MIGMMDFSRSANSSIILLSSIILFSSSSLQTAIEFSHGEVLRFGFVVLYSDEMKIFSNAARIIIFCGRLPT